MGKSYNLASKSDMRKFEKNLKEKVSDSVKKSASSMEFEIDCPKCGKTFSGHEGVNVCPHCGEEVNLHLNLKLDL